MLQWFKKHPDFLRRESNALANDSNYKELFQFRDNLFISHGNIIVRVNGLHRFPILVLYSDATPYRLPMIFPLERQLSQEEIVQLSKLQLSEALENIKSFTKFYYNLRHQNSSGELCTLEREDLDKPINIYGISTILQRVTDWHAGHITGEYPPDSEDVNFIAHFNNICSDTKFFYSEQFLDLTLAEGDCYANLFKFIPKDPIFTEDKYIYFGCFIDGKENGIFKQINIDLSRFGIKDIKTSLDLYSKNSTVERLLKDKILLKASWFHISSEPAPFRKIEDLITIIGNGDYQQGLSRLFQSIHHFKNLDEYFFLGLRFPNRKGIYEFQLFKISKKELSGGYVFVQTDNTQKIKEIFDCYDKIEAIQSEKLTEESFHQRNSKRADYDVLKNASVNIFGVGALGSEIADCIAKAGVGDIMLVDNQAMHAHNAVRHLAGMEYIGLPKVIAVWQILNSHNPFVKILPITEDLYQLNPKNLEDDSITICSIADDNVEGFINQQLVLSNKPAFYVRALRGGKTARIFRIIPEKDACFHCLSLYRNENKHFIEIPEDAEYPTLKNECNNPIRPASAADLKLTASMASRFIIEHLQGGESENNHWIWSTETVDGTPINANSIHSQYIPPHKDCVYCNNKKKIKVVIKEDCISYMQNLIRENPTIETGGVMAGIKDEKGNIVITRVSSPGPKAVMSSTKFEKDIEFCQNFLDEIYQNSNQSTIYVGEWHSHPSANNHPSETDIKSLTEIAIEKNYLTDCPVMIIFSNQGSPSCTLHPADKSYYFSDLEKK
ncbi:ThiF family adenylyltransferase [Kaistella sp. 97-N-M2]|uniref:ThiF family adenylyltransferase n=1 Tax=Kaistella sp. 97-N-M2 TaxID=2908645 RepID=UPI001F30AAEB|nr:ThiF family adenylyltransferase [Kaistella sp. 97-N-M2]UJF29302.1 ThiF family adenylyltransferase [Kaistella sp. 97-N-M2]